MREKIDVVVKRETWARGFRGHTNKLLDEKGMRCCLGFVMQAEGFTDDELYDHSLPVVPALKSNRPTGLCKLHEHGLDNNKLTDAATRTNDSAAFSDAERERRLLELFKDSPYNLRFED